MSSGKYSAISGAVARMQMLENISEHLASAKVPGYKKEMVAFEAKLGEARSGMATKGTNYTHLTKPVIDFTPGHIEHSGDPLDLAISGDGFFRIQRPDGSFGYARKGNFTLNGDGTLIDTNGYPVMGTGGGEITLPNSDVSIDLDGTIWDGSTRVGQVGLFRFADTSVLKRSGGEMFIPVDGTQPEAHPNPKMSQQNLEASNIDMMKTMTRMTTNLRAFEATQKALKIYSDMGTKAADIGLVQ
ncbi:flagellar hook basal-body protein [uncultured Desulfuromusa sp.]|uniref:flagellar hook-basal body protein n=1 Tax=uncultured Desulfuromusa sp. TaxID=219183 RepID=UPI002AA6198A|nr:flagellar hook basal-body protein [uncultured Desulfuromusa sp.]